jgi:asparagine synthase (glutamine-hydrolysing)
MCGIAGGVALDASSKPDGERVKRMTGLLAHRGPDGEGFWTAPSGSAVLAHRRLAVIDLATGDQPMVDADGNVGMTFNGEIYNYVELRDALAKTGVAFRTKSDTEVLLARYLSGKSDWLAPCRGMFAFGIWDDRARRLTLVRDRIGKKPLFYVIEHGCLYFASSLRALRATSARRWTLRPESLGAYLALGYVPAPATMFAEAFRLPAGHQLTLERGAVATSPFWRVEDRKTAFTGTYEDALEETQARLVEAVRLRLRSDVPLGVFLSGGIDSSLVTAIAGRESTGALRTFSVGFDVAAVDESPHAAAVARHLGTEHSSFQMKPDLLRAIPDVVAGLGEPFTNPSTIPLTELARETRRHVTVVLGGDGGDEAFAGYPWYSNARRLERVSRLMGGRPLAPARRALAAQLSGGGGSGLAARAGRALDATAQRNEGSRFAHLRSLFSGRERHALLCDERARDAGVAASEQLAGIYDAVDGDALQRMRSVDIATYLADSLMPKGDVATMAHGLELRSPLLDHEVVDFALSIPEHFHTDERGGKRILRELVSRFVPSEVMDRPKQGFTVPLDEWFRGETAPIVASLARSDALAALAQLDMRTVASLCDEHRSGSRNHGERLFALLTLEAWVANELG